jgi:hypothetical protein
MPDDGREERPKHVANKNTIIVLSQMVNVHMLRIGLRWAGYVAPMGEMRDAYRDLVGKPERRRPLGRFRHRWEENIKMYFREVGWGGRRLD